jgi:hypothetical protein
MAVHSVGNEIVDMILRGAVEERMHSESVEAVLYANVVDGPRNFLRLGSEVTGCAVVLCEEWEWKNAEQEGNEKAEGGSARRVFGHSLNYPIRQ